MRHALSSIALFSTGLAAPALTQDVPVRSFGIQGVPIASRGDYVVFVVNEMDQAGTDLNGDGDALDGVLHLLHVSEGTVENLELASWGWMLETEEPWLAMFVLELSQGGVDLTGDGDVADSVLILRNLESGRTINTGLPATLPSTAAHGVETAAPGERFGFAVSESAYGRDLNGDRDAFDYVAHVWDARTGEVQNLELALASGMIGYNRILLDERFALLVVPESKQGVDANGDGVLWGDFLHVHDFETGLTRATRWGGEAFTLADGQALIYALEGTMGVDLNGNGYVGDRLLWRLDLSAPGTSGFEVRLEGGPEETQLDTWREGERFAAFAMYEAADQNGDGDTADLLPMLVDKRTGAVVNPGLAIDWVNDPSTSLPSFVFAGDRLAVLVSEFSQGKVDLTGDGLINGWVLHVFDPRTGSALASGVPGWGLTATPHRVVSTAHEWWGGTDWNGDGDTYDHVALFMDPESGEVSILPFAVTGMALGYPGVFVLDEGRLLVQGALGGGTESTLHAFALETGAVADLGLPAVSAPPAALMTSNGRFAVFTVFENFVSEDLNGDGDTYDTVLHMAGPIR